MYNCSILNITLILISVLPFNLYAKENVDAGWHEQSIRHNNQMRYYRYFIPTSLRHNPDTVILLHGGTQSMRKLFRRWAGGTQEWETLAEENGFLLLVPNGVNVKNGDTKGDHQNWNDCRIAVEGNNSSSTADDVGFIERLIDHAKNTFDINLHRVYVTGASNGGMMTFRLITESSDRIAAAAVFIANQPVKTDCRKPETTVPLMLVSGTEDPLMLWQGGQIRGEGPKLMSATATRDFWLKVNHADTTKVKTVTLPDKNKKDDSFIIKSVYPALSGGDPLWFYEVHGGGHTMPSIKYKVPFMARILVGKQNRDIEGAREAWLFLKQFSRQ